MAKAPKPPKSPVMEAGDRLRTWARSAEFSQPVRWGEIEAHILSEPTPSHAELEEAFPPRSRSRVVPFLIVAPLALVTSGSSLVALGLAAAHVFGGANARALAEITQFFVLAAIIISCVPVVIWLSTRRRSGFQLLLCAGTALASAATFILLSTEAQVGVWSTIRTMTAGATVTGLAGLAFLLAFTRRGPGPTWSERLATSTIEHQWLRSQRALVLEVLVKQGLMSRWDVSDLMELPTDTWKQLETRPDGRIVRHRRS